MTELVGSMTGSALTWWGGVSLCRPKFAVFFACVLWGSAAQSAEISVDPGTLHAPGSEAISNDQLAEGKSRFEAACSACHGAGARGGRNGARDLLTSELAQGEPAAFREFVSHGSPEGGMPGFALDNKTIDSIRAHLKSLAAVAAWRGRAEMTVVGDPNLGRIYFEGKGRCMQCHSAMGDLQGIGSRYPARVVQGRLVLPRGNGVHPGLLALGVRIPGITDGASVKDAPRTVTVRVPGHDPVSGVLIAISDFDVSLRDAEGRYVAFGRNGNTPEVTITDPVQAHVDALGHMTDDTIHDLTAYLTSLR